jgi:hypothetical protein
MKHIRVAQTLDRQPPTKHTRSTCGLSRRGGVRTSNSERRSRFLGRVAVAYVQGKRLKVAAPWVRLGFSPPGFARCLLVNEGAR